MAAWVTHFKASLNYNIVWGSSIPGTFNKKKKKERKKPDDEVDTFNASHPT